MRLQDTQSTIKQWAKEDRPREKSILYGHEKLSDAELLAIIIGSGTRLHSAVSLAQQILNACQNNLGQLRRMSLQELMQFKGIGKARAVTIKTVLELAKRLSESKPSNAEIVEDATSAYNILRPYLEQQAVEESYVLYLNQRNQILSIQHLSIGGITQTIIDKRSIFKRAIELGAVRFIMAHNHPSGNLKPSDNDKFLTKEIYQAGQIMGIQLLDHIIVGQGGYFSFSSEGLLNY